MRPWIQDLVALQVVSAAAISSISARGIRIREEFGAYVVSSCSYGLMREVAFEMFAPFCAQTLAKLAPLPT